MDLTMPLTDGIYYKDKFFKLNTDFKVWLKIDSLLTNDFDFLPDKLFLIISLAYEKSFPEDINIAFRGVTDFYSMFSGKKKGGGKKLFSFGEDGRYIFSAFFSQYGIDLFKTEMHWWKFLALFEELNEQTLFGKILKYRSVDLGSVKDKKLKSFYTKMKSLYSLETPESIADAFFAV